MTGTPSVRRFPAVPPPPYSSAPHGAVMGETERAAVFCKLPRPLSAARKPSAVRLQIPPMARSDAPQRHRWAGPETEKGTVMTQQNDLNTPWSLHFDRDGTEDVAIICDAHGEDLVRSRHFWLPEGDDPVSPTLAALRLMAAAPKLLDALHCLLEQTVDMDLKYGVTLGEGEQEARAKALAAIAEATAAEKA
jgi:hypothetical protein